MMARRSFNFNPLRGILATQRPQGAKQRRISTGYGSNWKAICAAVRRRDNNRCQARRRDGSVCGAPGTEVHHLIPAAQGGRATMSNLITICHGCHCRQPGHGHMRNKK